jgi:DNA-binding transcriptional ArsR family regulator
MKASDKTLSRVTEVLKSIANPIRLKILCLLASQKSVSVNDIAERMGCEQSLTSHHLNNLRSKGVVTLKRSGKHVYYTLKNPKIIGVVKCIIKCDEVACRN